ncbi:gag-pol polyprotein [Striga asiatica]|uniref:Gag-pol polyprotein n=1 Tax=Striga asiatica TaxID=4170 RepID=A0A5A7QPA5_STRAF|nr:gag-pol polyprotein [Striga asiatica]
MPIIPIPVRTRHQQRPPGTVLLLFTAAHRPPDNGIPRSQPPTTCGCNLRRRRCRHNQHQNRKMGGGHYEKTRKAIGVRASNCCLLGTRCRVPAAMQIRGSTPVRVVWRWWAHSWRAINSLLFSLQNPSPNRTLLDSNIHQFRRYKSRLLWYSFQRLETIRVLAPNRVKATLIHGTPS